MIDLHFWPTPNGFKILIYLEEASLPYRLFPVDIGRGDQFSREFLSISPNNRIPAIVDHDPSVSMGEGESLSLFESGAILIYLAEKTGQFLPSGGVERTEVMAWLMWQMGGLGPMGGQAHHFLIYASEEVPYAQRRYRDECRRLYGVLERRLSGRDYVAGAYSIADMAIYPWAFSMERQGQRVEDFPNVRAYLERMRARKAVQRAQTVGSEVSSG